MALAGGDMGGLVFGFGAQILASGGGRKFGRLGCAADGLGCGAGGGRRVGGLGCVSLERQGGNGGDSGSGGGRAPEGLVAMHPPLVQSPHASSAGSILPGTMLATLLAVAPLIALAWLGQKKTYTNLT